MRITARPDEKKPIVLVEHDGHSLAFDVAVFQRSSFKEGHDVYDIINRYWSRMSLHQQSEIFAIYFEAYRAFSEVLSEKDLYHFLNHCVKELIKHHPLDRLELFLASEPSVVIPDTVVESFQHSPENKNTRDKTYDIRDYRQLLSLALFMRTLTPIWGQYVASIKKNCGVDHKEYLAFQLIADTDLIESSPMVKLSQYIEAMSGDKKENKEQILKGISGEDSAYFLRALICIRRFAVGDLTGRNPKLNLLSKLFNFLRQKVSPAVESSRITTKVLPGDEVAEDNHSVLESYRNRAEHSVGDIAAFNHVARDIETIIMRLAPDLPRSLLERSMETSQVLVNQRLGQTQLSMLAWVFKTVIPPLSVNSYVIHKNVARLLGVLEAVLWHLGHKYLATVATAHLNNGQEIITITPIDSRKQIPEDIVRQIKLYYPFTWSSAKRRANDPNAVSQETHDVLADINRVMDDLVQNGWRKTCVDEMSVEVYGNSEKKLRLLSETKTHLAKLVVDIEERRYRAAGLSINPSKSQVADPFRKVVDPSRI